MFQFMHNGGIAEFPSIKRKLQKSLPDVAFNMVQGNTDSEWAFALFLSKLDDPNGRSFTPDILRKAMLETIAHLNTLADEADITEWFSSGTTFSEYADGGHYKMSKADRRENIIMATDWMEIKTNNMVVITPKMNLLQIPIIDKYYIPPSGPGASARATEFAREKGFLNPHTTISPIEKPSAIRRAPSVGAHCC
ncbi:hypothetical protein DXG03_006977 [Asterophora parasitica]|uniref:Glutamine amidotransferase type-2 domain-containing protein n=1 Tax=Asterophora parasitica TaxID=117018 RepID=A0A9P7GG07_9AGAR|nr:hypothetical protein DXG03_006977 [Asterophora parasitica]